MANAKPLHSKHSKNSAPVQPAAPRWKQALPDKQTVPHEPAPAALPAEEPAGQLLSAAPVTEEAVSCAMPEASAPAAEEAAPSVPDAGETDAPEEAAETPDAPEEDDELIFEVYFDESSDFETPKKDWIIAGYACPRPKNGGHEAVDRQAVAWWEEIWEKYARENPGYVGSYRLAHCAENSGPVREIVQPMVLNLLLGKIRDCGGYPVVFICPKGECIQHQEINYFAVLTHGYVLLLNTLKKMYPDKAIRVVPYISKTVATDYIASATTEAEMTMLRQHYEAIIGAVAFNHCTPDDMNAILDNLQIIHGRTKPCVDKYGSLNRTYGQSFNLHNVIADYISNSYFSTKFSYKDDILAHDPILCTVPRMKKEDLLPAEPEPAPAPQPAQEPAPAKPFTLDEAGIDRLNAVSPYEQRSMLAALYNDLHIRIMRQIDMDGTHRELNGMLEMTGRIAAPSIRAEAAANLLLFKIALLNHHGNMPEIEKASSEFIHAVSKVQDEHSRNALISMYANRQIVLYTDLNDYDRAEKQYLEIAEYWTDHLESCKKRFKTFGQLFTPSVSSIVCPEYGRAVGSVLQAARKRMRTLTGAERFNVYWEALRRAPIARLHLEDPEDIARLEQTLCDLDSENGFFESALCRLTKAAQLILGEETDPSRRSVEPEEVAEACRKIIQSVGLHTDKMRPFMLSHYARLASEMFILGEEKSISYARTMIQTLLETEGTPNADSYQEIRSPHPRTQILWKLGSALVRSGMREEGMALMAEAFRQLSALDNDIFDSIALAVRAEMALLSDSDPDGPAEITVVYQKFLGEKQPGLIDPFAGADIPSLRFAEGEALQNRLFALTRAIGY